MVTEIKIFRTPYELAEKFAGELIAMITESAKRKKLFTVALSGGSTPELLFSLLGDHFSNSASWEYVHFFWGDERCVAPDNSESNYGMTKRVFLDKILIPPANIHRIMGENDPAEEAMRYSAELTDLLHEKRGFPVFSLILLGLGEDGHTASIFPGNNKLLNSEKVCEVAVHPVSFQKRITLTGRVIMNAENVTFLVTGEKKAKVVCDILGKKGKKDYPAESILPYSGVLKWYIDEAAATMIRRDKITVDGQENEQ